MLTISQILPIAYKAIYQELKLGTRWNYCKLRKLEREHRIKRIMLGCFVEVGTTTGNRDYPIEQLTTTFVWGPYDDDYYDTEPKRVRFVKNLLIRTLIKHDSLIHDKLENHCMVASKQYVYELSEQSRLPNGSHIARLYTAGAFIPTNVLPTFNA